MNDQGQLDADTMRHISENAEVEHAILTPFRWMIGAGKALIYLLLITGWFLFTLLGWTVNVGEYSLENRREAICDSRAYLNLCDTHQFDAEHVPAVVKWSPANNTDVTIVHDAYRPNWDGDRILFNPLQTPSQEELDAAPKPWINFFGDGDFFQRSDDVFRRKSARMDRAIELGATSTERLRIVIADVKHINRDRVRLTDTPVIELQEGTIPGRSTYFSPDYHVVYGMCLEDECAADGSDLNYYLAWGDVLYKKPRLSEHQENAVRALMKLTTEEYWLQQAHQNSVHDDGTISNAFQDWARYGSTNARY